MRLSELFCRTHIRSVRYGGSEFTSYEETRRLIDKTEIKDITCDSREAQQGSLMICIRGMHSNANLYAADAVRRGACAIVTDHPCGELPDLAPDVPVIEVESSRLCAAYLYDMWNGEPSKRVKLIAVTGTNGKTSITFMLKSIFEAALIKCGIIGTVKCEVGGRRIDYKTKDPSAAMTTPDPEQLYEILRIMADEGAEYVFIEATSHALALDKLAPMHFQTAIFTNLTPDHLDFHGSMEEYFKAKTKLFLKCDRAILNADDRIFEDLRDVIPRECRVISCSAKYPFSDYCATEIHDYGTKGCGYKLVSKNLCMNIRSKIPGSFTVMNTLQAASAAIESGISPAAVFDALSTQKGIDGRMERVAIPSSAHIEVFIDYAHTPDALERLLRSVSSFKAPSQRTVLVFGCGGDRDRTKRPIMGHIATTLANKTIITSDNSRGESPEDIINDILSGVAVGSDHTVIPDRRKAIEHAIMTAKRDDIIILAGKGHEGYEIIGGVKRPFDERGIVLEAVKKYF